MGTYQNPVMLPSLINAGRFDSSRDVPYHSHAGTELVLVTSGRCRVDVTQGFWGNAGTLFVLPGGIPHSQRNEGDVKTTYVAFKSQGNAFDESARDLFVPTGDPLRSWLEDLAVLHIESTRSDEVQAGGLLLACLGRILEIEKRVQYYHNMHPVVRLALDYIEAHLEAELSARLIARHACASVSHLNLLFRTTLGRSPLAHANELRLQRAQRMLHDPYSRVEDVGLACGFSSANYFVRCFKKRFGATPGRWRQEAGAGNRSSCGTR